MVAIAQKYYTQLAEHASVYYAQAQTQASVLYEQAKSYVTAAQPNREAPYHWNRPDGSVAVLSGQAKELAILSKAQANRMVQFKHINNVVSGTLALMVSYYSGASQSSLPLLLLVPLACGYNKLNQIIVETFKPIIEARHQEISKLVPSS